MNYWSIAPGELESLMFRRPMGNTAGFDGIPGNFAFEVRDHTTAQNNSAPGMPNTDQNRAAMKQGGQQQQQQQPQQQQQQQTNQGMNSAPQMYHHQSQQQQAPLPPQPQQQQHHGAQQQHQHMKEVKTEPMDRSLQGTAAGGQCVQKPFNNEILLFPATNSQTSNANMGPSSVVGVLLPAITVASSITLPPGNNAPPAALIPNAAPAKEKKKKQKKPTGSVPPTMVAARPPAPRAQCLLCERNYGNRRDLRRHVLAHHEGVRYVCRLCSKVMMSSKSVRAHLKSSAHRLLNDDEIAMNIEKITPTTNAAINSFDASASSGSMSTTKKT